MKKNQKIFTPLPERHGHKPVDEWSDTRRVLPQSHGCTVVTGFTVSIGIPAFNEGKNIVQLLQAILNQNNRNFAFQEIIVVSDGSTDDTEAKVRQAMLHHPSIKLIADGKRMGYVARLNQLFRANQSDVLVIFDGDVTLGGLSVIEEIVKEFSDPEVGLVGGNDMPTAPENLFEKIVITGIKLWYETRKNINGGTTVYNHHGCVSASSRQFCQQVKIPNNIIAADTYLYFQALKLGFKFRHAKRAIVYYRAPNNLKDYFSQTIRFFKTKSKISEHFGSWIQPHRKIDKRFKIRATLKIFLQEPVNLILYLCLRLATKLIQFYWPENYNEGLWQPVLSTKRGHKKLTPFVQ